MPLSVGAAVTLSPSLPRASPSVSRASPSVPRDPREGSRQRSLPNFYVGGGASPEPVYGSDSDAGSTDSGGTQPPPPRSPSAHPPAPTGPVHEVLLQKGRMYMQRREALQEESLRAEQGTMRRTPRISKHAREKPSSVPIVERCLERAALRQRELELARAAAADAAAAEVEAFPFRPRITRRGRAASGRAHSAGAAQRHRGPRQIPTGPTAEELAECNFAPQINRRSAVLAERQRRRLGVPQGAGPTYTHADSLLERDHMARLRTAAKLVEEERQANPHHPVISDYAKSRSPSRQVARGFSPGRGGPRRPQAASQPPPHNALTAAHLAAAAASHVPLPEAGPLSPPQPYLPHPAAYPGATYGTDGPLRGASPPLSFRGKMSPPRTGRSPMVSASPARHADPAGRLRVGDAVAALAEALDGVF